MLCLLLAFGTGSASTTFFWRDDTYEAFSQGKVEGVSISEDGELTLSPRLKVVADLGELYVWSMARDSEGNIYAGTGNEGKVFRISPKGKVELIFDSPEVGIQSLAVDGDGTVYAGSSPDGVVYRIPKGGPPSTFCHTGRQYVWALTFGGDGKLYAAAGPEGALLRVEEGKVEEVFKAPEEHIMCLMPDGRGGFYAGGAGKGLVYYIDPKGRGRALYDAEEKEVHVLAPGKDGDLYIGAMSGEEEEGEGCAVYRLEGGLARPIWRFTAPLLLTLNFLDSRELPLLVGTGKDGELHLLSSDGKRHVHLVRFKSGYPLCALKVGGDVYIGTGDVGKVYKLESAYLDTGRFTSKVYDAGAPSRWGRADWKAEVPRGTELWLRTRSGNTEEPDETWSDWSEPLKKPGPIRSPPARFLQYQLVMRSDGRRTPVVREVVLSGVQANLPPEVRSVSIEPYKVERRPREGKTSRPEQAGPPVKRGVYLVRWEAEDPNGDRLNFRVLIRPVGGKEWKVLEEELSSTSYIWDTETTADGEYELKVEASDLPSNPPDMALKGERVSRPFFVDHAAPYIEAKVHLKGRKVEIEGKVRDETTPVRGMSYALDSGKWRVVLPEDGVWDSKEERFSIKISLEPGEHSVVLRASDLMGNSGVRRVWVRVR